MPHPSRPPQPLAAHAGVDLGLEAQTHGRKAGANAAVMSVQDFATEQHMRGYWKAGSAEYQLAPLTGDSARLQITTQY